MPIRITVAALAIPLVLLGALLWLPGLDHSWGSSGFHFYVVSAACILAAVTCAVLIISARSIRQTRILFLALAFLALAVIFGVHGLTTPGHLYHQPTAAIGRSPWLGTLAAGIFATLSVISVPRLMERTRLRLPELVFAACAGLIGGYFAISLASPNWLEGFPTQKEWFQHTLTALTVCLLSFAGWRYLQSYMFARLPSQLTVMAGLLFLAEAQLSLDFGHFWAYSWWMYHFLFLGAFLTVLAGWLWEFIRAGDVRVIADGIAMRDALTQFSRGRSSDLVDLADQIENHDLETSRHVDRVAAIAYAIGLEMGFAPPRLRQLVMAAQLHDVGKIGLPPYILAKTGKLTEGEFDLIKLHPGKGHEIVQRMRGFQQIAGIVRHHHERFDGSGYPDQLAGDGIPLEARIIAVADTFDALISQRPYRAAMTVDAARDELARVSGTQLDPDCTRALLKLLEAGAVPAVTPELAAVNGV